MLRFSTNNEELNYFDILAFDMDGTLYDEFDFIQQVYGPIAKYIVGEDKSEYKRIYSFLLDTWIEYGSSKTNIFQLAFREIGRVEHENDINRCVELFRNNDITLVLSERTKFILDLLVKLDKELILISDGNSVLQRRKIEALGLNVWFPENHIFISGDYGKEYQKPGVKILSKIQERIELKGKHVCYFGDRQVDKQFAEKAGFAFYYAPCTHLLEEKNT